ncbi:MAG: UvrD-helicase domain-containing protein [Spirochaetales bacterium]|nr:UvrD-helicase domain-containing protein [Spirochaetales bacterium]
MGIRYRDLLNDEQYEAVRSIDGPLLILAGAGSGKTRVITFRIAYLLEHNTPQRSILAVTFTNKAAKQMSRRIRELTGKKLPNLTILTFHSFGARLLREHITTIGYRPNFSIYDSQDVCTLIKEVAREAGLKRDEIDPYALSHIFSGIKTGRTVWTPLTEQYKHLYEEYLHRLKLYNALDFDDLIVLPVRILSSQPETLASCHARYRYFMVDEFQDTSLLQYEFIRLLASESKNLCVVGDDDQSIYSWRGANYENILRFERDFPGFREVKLEQNYRSTGKILNAANRLISVNKNRKEKQLWTVAGEGNLLRLHICENEQREGDLIAEQIQSLSLTYAVPYREFGVLVRTNSLTRPIEEAFLRANIPYRVSGGMSFFERKEVKDIIAYLRIAANPDDDMNLLRIINIPRRGIGKKTIEYITSLAKTRGCSLYSAIAAAVHAPDAQVQDKTKNELADFFDLVEYYRNKLLSGKKMADSLQGLVERINYWEYLVQEHAKKEVARWKYLNVEGVVNSLADYESDPDIVSPNLYAYLNRITLLSHDDDEDGKEENKVHLMTIHAAKGLEFDVVFAAGCEDSIIPHRRSVEENEANIEEERRLFYVAITRAKRFLFLTSCRQRRKKGKITDADISPFLEHIPSELMEASHDDEYVSQEDAEDYFRKFRKDYGR